MKLVPESAIEVPSGSGPRHMAFHPNGKLLFVICELSSRVMSYSWDGGEGPKLLASCSTIEKPQENMCADIHVHPSGRYLFASNRGSDTLGIIRIN